MKTKLSNHLSRSSFGVHVACRSRCELAHTIIATRCSIATLKILFVLFGQLWKAFAIRCKGNQHLVICLGEKLLSPRFSETTRVWRRVVAVLRNYCRFTLEPRSRVQRDKARLRLRLCNGSSAIRAYPFVSHDATRHSLQHVSVLTAFWTFLVYDISMHASTSLDHWSRLPARFLIMPCMAHSFPQSYAVLYLYSAVM